MAAKRKHHDEDLLADCVDRVLSGESAREVSKQAQIPYTTLLGRVNWKKRGYQPAAVRRRLSQLQQSAGHQDSVDALGMTAPLDNPTDVASASAATHRRPGILHIPAKVPEVDEQRVLEAMARMQRAEICVRRRDVLRIANELREEQADSSGDCGTQWFIRFRERHPEVSGHGTNLQLADETAQRVLAAYDQVEARRRGEGESEGESEASNALARQEQVESQRNKELAAIEAAEAGSEPLTPSQQAVQVLQTTYMSQLSADDMVEAFDVMADPLTAGVFLVIHPGEVRDLWLRQRIRKSQEAAGERT